MALQCEMVGKSDPSLDDGNHDAGHKRPETHDEKYPACRGHTIPSESDRVGGRGQIADRPIKQRHADT